MKVVYTETHWLEFVSRFAAKYSSKDYLCTYVGFGCKLPYCNRPYSTCLNCPFCFTSFSI